MRVYIRRRQREQARQRLHALLGYVLLAIQLALVGWLAMLILPTTR